MRTVNPSRTRWLLHLWLCACLAATYVVADAPRASAGGVQDFQILYRVDRSDERGEGEIRLRFSLPDRWRIDTHTTSRDDTVIAVGDRVLVEDRRAKGFLLLARDQAGSRLSYAESVDVDLQARHTDWAGYLSARERKLAECGEEQGEAEVLGRPCRVYTWEGELPVDDELLPELLRGSMEFTRCVDRELLLPLEYEWRRGEQVLERRAAISVEVNGGVPEDLFDVTVPQGARVFRGGLARVPEQLFSASSSPAEDMLLSPFGQSTAMYVPEYVPAGFMNVGTSYDPEGRGYVAYLASESGATLVLAESRDSALMDLPVPAGAVPVSVGPEKGQLVEREEPFDRVVLAWQSGEWRLRLDAGGVPTAEVVKVAESMQWRSGKPLIEFGEAKAAQDDVSFLVLIPTVMPEGARLVASSTMPYSEGVGGHFTPEQLSMSYFLSGGGTLTILEMEGYESMEIEGWERVSIAGFTGWYNDDPEFGRELTWVQEGTEISLSGDLTKEEMVKMAESFAPTDPSARERLRRYQGDVLRKYSSARHDNVPLSDTDETSLNGSWTD